MRGAVVFVLTVIMVATPATQVLAQAPQQHDVPARRAFPPAQSVTPDATQEQSPVPDFLALPMTNPADAVLPTPDLGLAVALNPRVDETPLSTPVKVVLIVVAVVLVIGIIIFVDCLASSDVCLGVES